MMLGLSLVFLTALVSKSLGLFLIAALVGTLMWCGFGWARVLGEGLWLLLAGIVTAQPNGVFERIAGMQAEAMIVLLLFWLAIFWFSRIVGKLGDKSQELLPDQPGMVPANAPKTVSPPIPDPAEQGKTTTQSADELTRYARHIVLRELGGPGQGRLRKAKVLIVGAGGLGAPISLYLTAAGVGQITLADDDTVSISNLQRQVIYRTADDGRPKVDASAKAMAALNPHVNITTLPRKITAEDVDLIAQYDLVLDGTDSFAARADVNRACVAAGVPLVWGAMSQWEGQLTIWHPAHNAPCMACLFPKAPAAGLAPSCAEAGVVGPLPGIIGSMMALEAIKLIAGSGQVLRGKMLIFDGLWGETRSMNIKRRPDCAICGKAPDID